MTAISYSYARQNLKDIFDLATQKLEEIFVTRRNGKNIVIMAEEEFLGWKETIYLMSNPQNAAHLNKSLSQREKGETESFSLSEL